MAYNREACRTAWKAYGLENARGKHEFYWLDSNVKSPLVDESDTLFDASRAVHISYYLTFRRILDLPRDPTDDRGPPL